MTWGKNGGVSMNLGMQKRGLCVGTVWCLVRVFRENIGLLCWCSEVAEGGAC